MPKLAEFERYIDQLCEVLGHQDRHAGFAASQATKENGTPADAVAARCGCFAREC